MKRSTTHPQTLKHLPYFEVLATAPEGSPEAKLATAGLLTLRMIDHWVLAGPAIVEPESVSVRSVRQAITALPSNEPAREALLGIVNTMQMLREVDLIPVLPRVFAYAQIVQRHHGRHVLAADVYASLVRHADVEADPELVLDAYHHMAFCQRRAALLTDSEASSRAYLKLATQKKDRARVLRARMGLAMVSMMRGDLDSADAELSEVAATAEHHELQREHSRALHNRAVVAMHRREWDAAADLAHRALLLSVDLVDRDRLLADLGAILPNTGHVAAAVDAFRIVQLTGSSEEVRRMASANLLTIAAQCRDREMFSAMRREVAIEKLAPDAQVDVLVEVASCLIAFGETDAGEKALAQAKSVSAAYGLDASRADLSRACPRPGAINRTPASARSSPVAAAIATMAASLH
jgi:hypothetical protein